ncbi:hypothetical protein HUG15_19495 [Salicibibacter cibarius]|uniref:Uncharacterized protein n=1 Tax=Salicibibacter cibarius TaxID=2743000 RepID=A0A7T6Z5V9_9BACI|nr:hypothetical protein [Salicibibacter cibarius]QQK77548.1 hypothetical protein HUG15_19495 [Salicibibacter cibarius]
MKMQRLWLILGAMAASIFFFFFGLITSLEVISAIAQIVGFCGIIFTSLYGLLSKRTKEEIYEENKKLQL